MNPLLKVIGLMSGTSLDGLDIALVEIYETRGNFHTKNTHFKTYSYDSVFKRKLLDNINPHKATLESISDINFEVGEFFAQKVLDFCKFFNIDIKDIDLIGSHGHTFYHNFKNGRVLSTLQLGEPSVIANKTGVTTIADFRPADIALGGQGAPLVPFIDTIIFAKKNKSFVLQNIGGISNLTYLPKDKNQDLIAFDTGAGNMVIDALINKISKGKASYDKDGEMASKGKVNHDILAELIDNPYFTIKPPKSTGREIFGQDFIDAFYDKYKNENHEDLMATITFFVAKTIYDSYNNFLPSLPEEVVISGGGARNKTLVRFLEELLPENVEVSNFEKYGIISDAKEAVAFAILAYCTFFGITNNLPQATGARDNVVLGKICPAKNFNRVILKKAQVEKEAIEKTEGGNILSAELDLLTPLEIVELANKSDYEVISAVDTAKEQIASVLQQTIDCFLNDGKLFYIGAGTSGRLGVLDASECPPTFKANPEKVQGIIAGGTYALTNAVEGAEDSGEDGRKDVKEKISAKDILVGISANGNAPYVIEALDEAKKIGAKTALITCNNIPKRDFIDDVIYLDIGAEILSGSTRLKSGTVTKMVLNILTTGAFAKTGKVYGNYMVDVKVSNKKLKRRAVNIIKALTDCTEQEAETLLNQSEGSVKHSILMYKKSIDYTKAKELLDENNGFLRNSLE